MCGRNDKAEIHSKNLTKKMRMSIDALNKKPGPGEYNPILTHSFDSSDSLSTSRGFLQGLGNASSRLPLQSTYRLPIGKKDPVNKGIGIAPGPGAYNFFDPDDLVTMKASQKTIIGTARREGIYDLKKIPGPSDYKIPSIFGSSKRTMAVMVE